MSKEDCTRTLNAWSGEVQSGNRVEEREGKTYEVTAETHSGGCMRDHITLYRTGWRGGLIYIPAIRPLQFFREHRRSMASVASCKET